MAGDMYLENLEEFVFDENRIVTYKWLSQTLQVHVNLAKQMLYTFFNQQKDKEADSVNVTYLVSGVQSIDNGEKVRKVSIVNAQNLEKHKASLQCVSGVHIYSIQKAQLKDSNSLYTADYDLTLEQIKQAACSRFSAIECAEAKARSETELAELEEKARLPDANQSQSTAKVNGKPSTSSSNGSVTLPSLQKAEAAKPAPKTNDQRKKGQRSAMDMFTSMKVKKEKDAEKEMNTEAEKTTKTEKDSSLDSATENKAKPENKSKKGMLAFMSTVPKKTTEEEKQENKESSQKVNVLEKEEKKTMKEESNNSKSTNKNADNKETKIQKKTKRIVVSDSDEEESNPKKKQRRRIMMAESSSDEDEEDLLYCTFMSCVNFSNVTSNYTSIVYPTPPQKPVDNDAEDEMDCGEPNEGGGEVETGTHIKRIKVFKTRQVEDEEGFMVTEKYYEYEDTEVVDEEKPPMKEVRPLKKSVPDDTENEGKKGKGKKGKGDQSSQGTTQKSLLSFFKKN
ncbi:DNA polymerase delta subunit 3-like [Anneissia japonica]|uniref:DNA polymerase delta subunit 3-like n=1 Tax=Anneissia japonica TaxID=1529436 RepID=UPI0014257AE6|nr:DNA polymerase delta subunit 3-like [Anneissia japonica]